jgi:hypothetical protein
MHVNILKTEEIPYTYILTGFRLLPQYWGRILGSFFYGGVSPSKIGPIAPY